ncbi:MAG: NADH-quinone oxidoreductase subunit H [Candidatus Latescibacteria bacterium]|nr:NADH-quinone oxidoreductase subunit H [Candidatus Latescibacterota bacterium]NIM22001.1 NADH-quinone oxidoreductase subunit H [Candidatus Latescibacterota bacterium]NIM66019.1 NADH-quinone oxidoreductase subunit H [Candidatus Latescibacterota bacterium]NIO02427.1 NADH-quinone oxidoreductase subunit H [Candidatus Latescibacterota bacterium]NIO29338.1 NADH-quinone oxidoreductase subunit H [Candidatus Latescibacterota bacterium]
MAENLIIIAKTLFVIAMAFGFLLVVIWFERKGSAFIQDRVGPNRAAILGVRLAGFIQNFADVTKLIMKEMFIPGEVNRIYFILAPFIGFTFILTSFAVIPFADNLRIGGFDIPMQVADLNVGVLYILAITSLNVYGIVLAGWSSNNKFSLLGGLRSTAQMISYEIPLGLSIVGIFMVFGSLHLNEIVRAQGELLFGFLPRWGIFVQPLGFIIFISAAYAEANRTPFDIPEGESEIVAGYHVEYSGMRFALFYMGEYIALVLSSALVVTLFFGGWQIPYLDTSDLIRHASVVLKVLLLGGAAMSLAAAIAFIGYAKRLKGTWGDIHDREGHVLTTFAVLALAVFLVVLFWLWNVEFPDWAARTIALISQVGMFLIKVLFFGWLFIWVRWTLPRFRYDQLMGLGWKALIPLSFINILISGLVILLVQR